MTVLVNYYTCSYGDSLVNMFCNNPVVRDEYDDGQTNCNFNRFIDPDFYNQSIRIQLLEWHECQKLNLVAVPCHRQNAFNFNKVFGQTMTIITIKLDQIDFLANRFKKIHLDGRGKVIIDPLRDKLIKKYPNSYNQIIEQDYYQWYKNNCFKSDVVFDFSWIFNADKTEQFCHDSNLSFNQNWLIDIQKDLKQYVVS